MTTQNEEWLALTMEKPIDSNLPICDPHHHLWDRPDDRYLPEDFLHDIIDHKVVKTVFVECSTMYREDGPQEMKPVGETKFVQGFAVKSENGKYGKTDLVAGIVGFADLTLGKGVEPVLEAHIASGKNHFRGIRHPTVWDPSPEITCYMNSPKGLLLNPRFREGFACLQKYGLSFDAWLFFHQLMELADLARAFPEIPIIVNHIGGPIHIGPYAGKREEVFKEWKRGIVALASCPNVVVKLGGLGMPRCGFGWYEQQTPPSSTELAEAMSPYYLWCVEQFGVDRCMFESNFPVDKTSYSYTVLWNAFKRITRDFSPEDRAALFHDTAVKVYRLESND
jgi:predicted TIM-barrel fold metal-dependent hydrolase